MTYLVQFIVCFIAGIGAGLGTGFAGMSAAAVISPMLITFLGMDPYMAVGIALASDVLASAVSAYTYKKNGNLDVKNGAVMMAAVLVFTMVGSFVASKVPGATMGSFSVFMTMLLGVKFIVRPVMTTKEAMQGVSARKRLVQALERCNWRVGTGFLSTPLILDVLTHIDIEKAYRLLENEEMPGWLFMPKSGATTIWEAWEGNATKNDGIGSLNHYSKGAMVAWLFETMCGIQVAGENHFVIAPHPGGHFTHAKAVYASVYGTVESGWEKKADGWHYTVTVPANCTAQVLLPGKIPVTLETGTFCF